VGSRGGAGHGMIDGDAPRRRRDDRAEEAAPTVGGGLRVLWPETEARGAVVGASERGEKKSQRGGRELSRR
jgi:hypothetical protein